MISIAESFFNRVTNGTDRSNSLAFLSEWICKHTFLSGKPFSFKHHEYQKQIVDDPHSRKNVKKCSQVGLSELSVRITLAFLSVSRSKRAIYTLPTSRFASKFAKDRFDPVIEESELLTSLRVKSADSAEMKRLGSSTLYLNGTFGQSAAISIAAHMLLHDEIDFSDADVVATYQSRLRHAEEDEYGFKGLTYRFSTPTVKGFGISEFFNNSTKNYYMCKCSKCSTWVAPDFFRDVVLPGYDKDLRSFSSYDAKDPNNILEKAYIKCSKCGHDLINDLKDPMRREWVAMNPKAREAGYQVNPFDVPVYNTIPSLLLQAADYKRIGDWHNFTLGMEYEDADNTFLTEPFNYGVRARWTTPEMGATGTFAGLDVGKISHIIIGKEISGRIEILYAAKLKMTGDLALATQVKELMSRFGVGLLVIDAMPDFSTALTLISLSRPGQVFANYYQQKPPKNKLTNMVIKEEDSVVSSYKTGVFDELCKLHNGFGISYPEHEEIREVARHMKNLKKIVSGDKSMTDNPDGVWVNTGEDHYGHAMNYAMIARELMESTLSSMGFAMPPDVTKIRMGTKEKAVS